MPRNNPARANSEKWREKHSESIRKRAQISDNFWINLDQNAWKFKGKSFIVIFGGFRVLCVKNRFRRVKHTHEKWVIKYDSSWFQSLKPLFCPWCICHFIEAQRNHENISLAPLFVPNSILTWEKKNEFWIPRDRWRGSWSVADLCISPRLQNQCRNHEGKGFSWSTSFFPSETFIIKVMLVNPWSRLWIAKFMFSVRNKTTNEMSSCRTQFVGDCWRSTLQATWVYKEGFKITVPVTIIYVT